MQTLLLFGVSPSKGTGYQVLLAAQKEVTEGHIKRCVALVRNFEFAQQLHQQGIDVIIGDALNREDVDKACHLAGADAIIVSTLGGENVNYEAHRVIIDSAEAMGIKNMLLVTSLGCGSSWSFLSEKAKKAFGHAVREKSLAEMWLKTSQLHYCILRPGGLNDGEPTGQGVCYYQQEAHGYINRRDLASIILSKIKQLPLDNRVYSVIDPTLIVKREYRN